MSCSTPKIVVHRVGKTGLGRKEQEKKTETSEVDVTAQVGKCLEAWPCVPVTAFYQTDQVLGTTSPALLETFLHLPKIPEL